MAGLSLAVQYTSGVALKAEVRKRTTASGVSDWWNDTTSAYVVSDPLIANYVPLTEFGSSGLYLYSRSNPMGTYTGEILVQYRVGSLVVGYDTFQLVNGLIADQATIAEDWKNGGRLDTLLDNAASGTGPAAALSPHCVANARTFFLCSHSDSVLARNIVTVAAGTVCTFSMDFSEVINGADGGLKTSLSSAVSATDLDGSPRLTFDNVVLSQDRTCVHFDNDDAADMIEGNTPRVKVGVITTDGQTLYGYGKIQVI